jgi:lactoylglutathione lyase
VDYRVAEQEYRMDKKGLCVTAQLLNRGYRNENRLSHEAPMKYLHTMVRVTNVEESLDFYCNKLGLKEIRRIDNEKGRFTLIFLAAPGDESAQVELTYNWDPEIYDGGRNFGHLAYAVDNIYDTCDRLMRGGVTINRPPRDGRMAFVRSPDNISIELLQKDGSLPPQEPWLSMPNTGVW